MHLGNMRGAGCKLVFVHFPGGNPPQTVELGYVGMPNGSAR